MSPAGKRIVRKIINTCCVAVCFHYAQANSQRPIDSLRSFKNGMIIFNNNCTVCHAIHHENIGPALASISKKKTKEWLFEFIRNSQRVIISGDRYATKLYNNYNHVMPSFDQLKPGQLENLLYY